MIHWKVLIVAGAAVLSTTNGFCLTQMRGERAIGCHTSLVPRMSPNDGVSGSFFNKVPDNGDGEESDGEKSPKPQEISEEAEDLFDFDKSMQELIRQRKAPPKASEPSTIGGIPTSKAKGFGTPEGASSKPPQPTKPYIGLGPPDRPVNDINNPEYDDQGFTVYTNEKTGEKKRVFEALVEYPCLFTMKIVGANEGSFVAEIVQVVAESCNVPSNDIEFTTRVMGKWTSVTVKAPVKSAEMLYLLYENIDRDPRVKFKF